MGIASNKQILPIFNIHVQQPPVVDYVIRLCEFISHTRALHNHSMYSLLRSDIAHSNACVKPFAVVQMND